MCQVIVHYGNLTLNLILLLYEDVSYKTQKKMYVDGLLYTHGKDEKCIQYYGSKT